MDLMALGGVCLARATARRRAVFILDYFGDFGIGRAVVVIIMAILDTLLRIFRKWNVDFGRANHFLTPSRVELIDKRSILHLETTTNR